MDPRPAGIDDDEISLMDIYDFIRDGWWTLIGMSVLGAVVGLVIAFVLPAKYEARGWIESGQVGFVGLDQGVASRDVEGLAVLAEKMKAPGYYSEATLAACGLAGKPNPRQTLVTGLGASVARNSNFVSVSYKAPAVDEAKRCIEQVLADVVANQAPVIEAVTSYTKAEIANTAEQLELAQSMVQEQRAGRDASLAVAQEQLAVARQELAILDKASSEDAASAGALAAVRVLNKRGEVQELESSLLALQSDFNAYVSDNSDKINRLTNRLTALQAAVQAPNTREARFATPVFAPETKVSPRRSLIAVLSVLIGGFLGLVILIGRRAAKHIREHEAQRRAQSSAL